jgi:histidyl-tRNA synthetase
MHTERKGIRLTAFAGGIALLVILVVGTIWMGHSARSDTEEAVRSVSLLYLDELAGRREQVVASNMRDKIKQFHNARDPFIIVLGDKEVENRSVSITARGNKKMNDVPLADFIAMCRKLNENHSLELDL